MDSNEPQHTVEEGSFFNPAAVPAPIILKHSGPGIASFILCMISLLGYIASVALIGSLMTPYLTEDLTSPSAEMIEKLGVAGAIVILFLFMNLIGVILGIVGVSLKRRKKIFAILGLIMNAAILLSLAIFFVIAVVNATI
ncbi:hypothetical protein [Paenibacillus macquariensis]|uniref:DUF4064 domain-containing protein n=1 Tax=Paenibacillus macquariensis TaxID=948756 RepID=A0ABY1JWX0_9BACL|nr:hypothetical protein [Paenibacillus macquariensis]MEC0089410.1 hypothetical protein [Paenibacillus macquariensis]OAB33203.1 hypothetical protein PMSM_14390 [Paenibacillus macquariensis subsp. macquariensis]SIQ91842.1 hypothetical protein SAMN05421578_10547 [Paenibacillus macquariensis]